MLALLDPAAKAAGVQALLAAVADGAKSSPGVLDHESCIQTHKLLLSGSLADAAAAADFQQRCAGLFSRSNYFGGPEATKATELAEQLADRIGAVQLKD